MDTRQKIRKALLLLDKGQDQEAVQLLRLLLQELDTTVFADQANAVRCAVILGDHFSQAADIKEATHWCTYALKLAADHPELEDAVGYELEQAGTLVNELKSK